MARAYAFTQAEVWAFARPGTVEVLLAPQVPREERPGGRVSLEALRAQESELVRTRIEQDLDDRRPLVITCQVHWTQYKTVRVKARIVSRRHSDPSAIRGRVIERLNQAINPLPTPVNPQGWPYGQALHASRSTTCAKTTRACCGSTAWCVSWWKTCPTNRSTPWRPIPSRPAPGTRIRVAGVPLSG